MLPHNDTINLAIVDDHPVVLEGLQKLLANEPHIRIAGCFTTAASFLAFIKTNQADIVLLDITLPDANGIDLCKEIKLLSPATSVLALSNHSERSLIMQMLQNGASGYLLKNASLEELTAAIHQALNGQLSFSREVQDIIAKPTVNELKELPPITKREKEILLLISEGKTTVDIATQLSLSPLTVETHRRNLLQKFDVKNVAALIRIAVQHGLI